MPLLISRKHQQHNNAALHFPRLFQKPPKLGLDDPRGTFQATLSRRSLLKRFAAQLCFLRSPGNTFADQRSCTAYWSIEQFSVILESMASLDAERARYGPSARSLMPQDGSCFGVPPASRPWARAVLLQGTLFAGFHTGCP